MPIALAGCAQSPVAAPPDDSRESSPVSIEDESSHDAAPAADETSEAAPPAAPPPEAAAAASGQRRIAVGEKALDSQYELLAAGRLALASRDVGYFVDVHEARLRQALTDTPVQMDRSASGLRLVIPGGLSFAPGSDRINTSARSVLAAIAAVLSEFDKTLISVHGHTDRSGDREYNRQLSERRAVAVAQFLAEHGIAPQRLVGVGHGEEEPVADGDSEAARAANRRIEILIEPIVTGGRGRAELAMMRVADRTSR